MCLRGGQVVCVCVGGGYQVVEQVCRQEPFDLAGQIHWDVQPVHHLYEGELKALRLIRF